VGDAGFHKRDQEPIMQTPTFTKTPSPLESGDGVSQGASRAAEVGERAAAVFDEKRDAVARALDAAASSLHARVESLPGGPNVARAALSTADTMEKAADYVRDQDLKGMLSDITQIAKRHPGATLLVATALGFMAVRAMGRNQG
jgi:hydroxypyruvate isomerase